MPIKYVCLQVSNTRQISIQHLLSKYMYNVVYRPPDSLLPDNLNLPDKLYMCVCAKTCPRFYSKNQANNKKIILSSNIS